MGGFGATTSGKASLSLLSNNNIIASYADSANSNFGTLNVVNTVNYSTYSCTIPAQAAAPTKSVIPANSFHCVPYSYEYIASNLNVTYEKLIKQARNLKFMHIAHNLNDVCTTTTFSLTRYVS